MSGQIPRLVVLLLLCFCLGAATADATDSCVAGVESDVSKPTRIVRYVPWADASACLDRLTITAEVVYETLAHLQHGIVDLYSFEGIASDSSKTEQSLAGGCKMPVHKVKVPLRKELERIRSDILERLGASDAEDLLKESHRRKEMPARAFHEELSSVFRRLHDAHTGYHPPWMQNFPLYVYLPQGSFGKVAWGQGHRLSVQLRLKAGDADPAVEAREVRKAGKDAETTSTEWTEVERLDGQPAFQYLTRQADAFEGNYKSAGARLNSLMNAWGSGRFQAPRPFPTNGKLEYTMKDGSRGSWEVIVASFNITNFSSFQAHVHSNHNWEVIEDFLQEHFRKGPKATTSRRLLPEAHWWETLDLWGPTAANPQTAREPRRLADAGVEEIGHFPTMISPIYAAYRLPTAVVFKVTTFAPPLQRRFPPPFDVFFSMMDLIKLYRRAVDTARAQGTDRLVLDLTDNGGGVVEFANLLTLLVAPRHSTSTELCAAYGVQMHKFWGKWLHSFGGGFEELERTLATESEAALEERLQRLKHLELLRDVMNGARHLPVDSAAVKKAQEEVAAATSEEAKREVLLKAFRGRGGVLEARQLSGANSSVGWFPFTGDVEDPETGKAFSPATLPYTDPETNHWGVEGSTDYTKRYIFACQLSFNPVISLLMWSLGASIIKAKHQWREIAVLTNGLCGSACSLFATQVQFKEGATVFTYGGIPGQLMDASAFAGGNVESYRSFWPKVLGAALVGDILFGPKTPIGQMLRAEGARERSFSRTLHLPLPTQAVARFNYNMMFMREFGPRALPREWYIIAAHHHFQEWHATSAGDPDTWPKLFDLYARIAGMDWADVRQAANASLAAHGISYSCASAPPTVPYVKETDWDVRCTCCFPKTPAEHQVDGVLVPDEAAEENNSSTLRGESAPLLQVSESSSTRGP